MAGLTIRFSYMANYINYDYTNEFMVYAHGAPATKSVVPTSLRSCRCGSMATRASRSPSTATCPGLSPGTCANIPIASHFGDNASQSLNESPSGHRRQQNWGNVDPFLANNYTNREYTFLWWPMEDYRRFSWNAIFGNPADETRARLGNPGVRQALGTSSSTVIIPGYGEVFGGTFTPGEWPLRHDLRLHIRKDVLADLWDYGVRGGQRRAAG